jgi:hypothetical protein
MPMRSSLTYAAKKEGETSRIHLQGLNGFDQGEVKVKWLWPRPSARPPTTETRWPNAKSNVDRLDK